MAYFSHEVHDSVRETERVVSPGPPWMWSCSCVWPLWGLSLGWTTASCSWWSCHSRSSSFLFCWPSPLRVTYQVCKPSMSELALPLVFSSFINGIRHKPIAHPWSVSSWPHVQSVIKFYYLFDWLISVLVLKPKGSAQFPLLFFSPAWTVVIHFQPDLLFLVFPVSLPW